MTAEMPPGGWEKPIAGPPPLSAPYAGWWSRVGATIVDALIVSVPALIVAALVFGGLTATIDDDESAGFFGVVLAILAYVGIFALALLLYAPLLMRREGERNGQTWGKQLFGIRVVRPSGVPIDFVWGGLREVVIKGLGVGVASAFIPLLPWLLDVLWPLWDDENRAVHDFIADTRVVSSGG